MRGRLQFCRNIRRWLDQYLMNKIRLKIRSRKRRHRLNLKYNPLSIALKHNFDKKFKISKLKYNICKQSFSHQRYLNFRKNFSTVFKPQLEIHIAKMVFVTQTSQTWILHVSAISLSNAQKISKLMFSTHPTLSHTIKSILHMWSRAINHSQLLTQLALQLERLQDIGWILKLRRAK